MSGDPHNQDARCGTCRFYVGTGDCHRFPPSVTADVSDGYDPDRDQRFITTSVATTWPRVGGDDWCGEFQHRHAPRLQREREARWDAETAKAVEAHVAAQEPGALFGIPLMPSCPPERPRD